MAGRVSAECGVVMGEARVPAGREPGDWYMPGPSRALGVDAHRASVARVYAFFLGSENHYQVDQVAAGEILAVFPEALDAVWSNRGFHDQAALWMARQGIRQFVDVGCGLPVDTDTYNTVRRILPSPRVIYVDRDPAVVAHAHALLRRRGETSVLAADICDPPDLVAGLHLDGLIDLAEPVGLLVTGVMHFAADSADPWGCVARVMAALAPGSFLALSHATADLLDQRTAQAITRIYAGAGAQLCFRTRAEVARFFDGLTLVPPGAGADPGVVHAGLWRCADPEMASSPGAQAVYCGVACRV